MKKLPYKKIFFNAFFAAILYGIWTYFANDIGAMKSAFTQATLSFTLTYFVAFYLELLNQKAKTLKIVIISVMILLLFLVIVQVSIHFLMNTENILKTVTPSLMIGAIYIVLYILHLNKKSL